jgi:hypothetical protein
MPPANGGYLFMGWRDRVSVYDTLLSYERGVLSSTFLKRGGANAVCCSM